jgi:hypothetical protein
MLDQEFSVLLLARAAAAFSFALATLTLAQAPQFTQRPDDPAAVTVAGKGDGIADDTEAIQSAIDRVQETHNQGIVFLPEGRYRITHTLILWRAIRVIGIGAHRPVIVLGKNTPGFQEGAQKYMVHFVSDRPRRKDGPIRDANPSTFYSAMSNIDLEAEEGNPAAIGIRFHIAQHCFLSHMTFRMGTARAALQDIGNQASDLNFIGGDYGILTVKTAPAWQFLLMDSTFTGQRIAAIHTQEAGMTIVRVVFHDVPAAVQVTPGNVEQLVIRNSIFRDISGPAISLGETRNLRSQASLEKIYCANVPTFLTDPNAATVKAPSSTYVVMRFTRGLAITASGKEAGITTTQQTSSIASIPELHSDVPQLPQVNEWTNVHALHVKGDGKADDTAALQAAIDAHNVLYLPTGRYRITNTLRLKPETVLIGLHPITTQIVIDDNTPAFAGVGAPVPMVLAPSGGTNILTGIGINTNARNERATGVMWMASEHSFMDDVKFVGGHGTANADGTWPEIYDGDHTGDPNPLRRWDAEYPSLWVRGGGGIFRDIWTANTFAQSGVRVEDTKVPGILYQLSSEHHVRNEAQFRHIAHWTIYDLQLETEKSEGAEAVAVDLRDVHDTDFLNTFLYRVSRTLVAAPSAITTSQSRNVRFDNVHSYSGTRFTYDNSVFDADGGVAVRAHNFNTFMLGTTPARAQALPKPAFFTAGASLKKLASGFSNATGLAVDHAGDVYFTDTRLNHIWRWNRSAQRLELVSDAAIAPIALGFDDRQNLLATSFTRSVFTISPNGDPQLLPRTDSTTDTWLLPSGLHNELNVLQGMLREKINFVSGNLTIPGSETSLAGIMASQLRRFKVGEEKFITSENDGIVYRATLQPDHTFEAKPFAFRSGIATAEDTTGNVYVAESQVFVYDKNGRQIGTLEVPELPTGIAFGGDGKTLFIAARSSLYSIRTLHAGKVE